MTKDEYLADLATKVEEVVGTISNDPVTALSGNTITEYTATVLEITGVNKVRAVNRGFVVINDGLPDEQAFVQDDIGLPKDDNAIAINYLATYILGGTITILGVETIVPAGVIINFELINARPDLGPFGFFDVRVMKNNGDGTVTPEEWRVQYDGNGDPYHAVVQ